MRAHVKSDIGLVRKTNEDSFAFSPPQLYIVADGMGGHVAGEVASSMAVKTVSEYVGQYAGTDDIKVVLEQAIIAANTIIYQSAQANPQYCGMGTTIDVAYIIQDTIYWAHVGDSRIYLIQSNCMQQLTDDHSIVWELVKSGSITPEEALYHPHRNMLTRAVGSSETIKVDVGETKWDDGDGLLLCTDGLTNMVSEQEICNLVYQYWHDGNTALEHLITQANAAGGIDNITAVLAQNIS